jgi:PilZ domain-containing protein
MAAESAHPDRRRTERFIAEPDVWVAWTDPERGKSHVRGRCLDVSVDGVRVELGLALPIGVAVTIGVPIRRLQKMATVRHCTPAGPYFTVGLEYVSPR